MIVPTEEDVSNVISILGLDSRDRSLVASALQAKNNNIEAVVNEFFDSPAKFHQQYSWDESVFTADRDGSTDNQVPSFSIHPPDNNQVIQGVEPGYYGPGAPSRPPSRTNSRSPLSKLVAYTADHSAGTALPTSSEQEDADLQRAIAESVVTSGRQSGMQSPQPLPQESGITQVSQADMSLPYFGPANRPGYDQDQWAMVALNRETPEPGPSRRKRGPDVPAFLRCRKDNAWERHRLGAILTIFHAIPAARNVLLRSGEPAQTYGHNPEWWKGKPILRPAVHAAESAGELAWESDARPGWSEELHRLMAFLDSTERSYGTADILTETFPEGSWSSGDCEKDFFEHIRNEPGNVDKMAALMATAEVVNVVGDGPIQVNEWGLLEPSFPREQLMMAENLYNIWDMMFFSDVNLASSPDAARMAMITRPAEVMTIRFSGDDGFPKPIEIPRVFYIDRYLASHKEEVARLQLDMALLCQGVEAAEKAEVSVRQWTNPKTSVQMDRVALIKAQIAKTKHRLRELKVWARWRKHEEDRRNGNYWMYFPMSPSEEAADNFDYTPEESEMKRALDGVVHSYENKLAQIEWKLQELAARKKTCQELYRELSAMLTAPSEEQKWNPTHAYTLRGVANSTDTFFVCLRAEPDLMEIDDGKSASTPAEQWWKLGYVADDEEPVKAQITTYEKAMEEACGIGSKPILIYASEKALQEDRDPLSGALQTFIRFDNRLFQQELKEESPHDRKRGPFVSPSSPSKRRNRSDSIDSMATNQASAGDLDDDMRDAPFEFDDPFPSGDESAATELRDMADSFTAGGIHNSSARARYPTPSESDDDRSPTPPLSPPSAGLDDLNVGAAGPAPELPPRRNVPEVAGQGSQQQTKSPEMQQRQGPSPFLVQPNNGRAGTGGPDSISMDLDDQHEG